MVVQRLTSLKRNIRSERAGGHITKEIDMVKMLI